jgi:hypothetical protein
MHFGCPGTWNHSSNWLSGQAGGLTGALVLDGKIIHDIILEQSVWWMSKVADGSPAAVAVMDQKENTQRREMKVAQQHRCRVACIEQAGYGKILVWPDRFSIAGIEINRQMLLPS